MGSREGSGRAVGGGGAKPRPGFQSRSTRGRTPHSPCINHRLLSMVVALITWFPKPVHSRSDTTPSAHVPSSHLNLDSSRGPSCSSPQPAHFPLAPSLAPPLNLLPSPLLPPLLLPLLRSDPTIDQEAVPCVGTAAAPRAEAARGSPRVHCVVHHGRPEGCGGSRKGQRRTVMLTPHVWLRSQCVRYMLLVQWCSKLVLNCPKGALSQPRTGSATHTSTRNRQQAACSVWETCCWYSGVLNLSQGTVSATNGTHTSTRTHTHTHADSRQCDAHVLVWEAPNARGELRDLY